MTSLTSWMGGLALLALAHAAQAETRVSQSNDPTAAIDTNLATLLGTERAALGAIDTGRFAELVTPPAAPVAASGAGAVPLTYDDAWVQALPTAAPSAQLDCLTKAIYFESRGEPIKGQAAVAEVVLNRVDAPQFPKTICGVVNQRGGGSCQFSFICDGRPDSVADRNAWAMAQKIASAFLEGAPRDLTQGATYFHAAGARSGWTAGFAKTARIGQHVFYRKGRAIVTAMN